MALVRCEQHRPKGRTADYVRSVESVGYPDSAAVCGLPGCDNPGLVWLTTEESRAYETGERIFQLPTQAAKVKAR